MKISCKLTAAIGVLLLTCTAHGAEFEVHPSVAASEEYNDNVFDTRDNRVTDYITHAMPSVTLSYKGPRMTADINYMYDFMYYAKGSHGTDSNHTLGAFANLNLVDGLLFLDVSDNYQRVSLDVTRDVTKETLFVNQSDRNVGTVSPYLLFHPTQLINVKTGYRYIDTRYFDSLGVDKTDHIGFMDASYELTPQLSATFSYNYTFEDSTSNDYNLHQASGGFRYEYADKSFLFAQGGYTWINYETGRRLDNSFWSAGLSHNFDTSTVNLTTGIRYDEDPLANITKEQYVNGSFDQQLDNGSVGLSLYYSEFGLPDTDILQTRKYGGVVRGNYQLSQDLSCRASFTAEKYDNVILDTYTRMMLAEAGLSYSMGHELTIALNYTYADYYSPAIFADNKHVNRAILQIRKAF